MGIDNAVQSEYPEKYDNLRSEIWCTDAYVNGLYALQFVEG